MFRKRIVCLVAALCLILSAMPALAAEVDCDAVYCFSSDDFAEEEPLVGICITGIPNAETGAVLLGQRIVLPGDILTADQLALMTFAPVRTEEDADAVVTYLPIYENRVEKSASMTIAIRGKEDKAPVAEDFTVETYKNLPNEGVLKVTDPEGQSMTFSVIRQPKRGTVEIKEDGSFVYTPKKNKVGVDSFTYTATDPAGKVSREATVTIQILKPTESQQYTDTVGLDCRFEAEWLRNTGLFVSEQMGHSQCFQPEKAVSQGQFLAMVMQMLEIPLSEQTAYPEMAKDAPLWLKPYLAAAMRSGLVANLPGEFDGNLPITGAEAAVMLQNALDLSRQQKSEADETATYTDTALAVMNENGLMLTADGALTRAQVAEILYKAHGLAQNAPGIAVFKTEQ